MILQICSFSGDGRSATARRFKDLVEDISADLGGKDFLSEGQRQLIRCAAMLSAEAERLEAMAVRDERFTHTDWRADKNNSKFVLCDRLGRLFDRLGLERRARPVEESEVVRHFKRRIQRPST
jgi:hypothetical protein